MGGADRVVKAFCDILSLKYGTANTYTNLPIVSHFKIHSSCFKKLPEFRNSYENMHVHGKEAFSPFSIQNTFLELLKAVHTQAFWELMKVR